MIMDKLETRTQLEREISHCRLTIERQKAKGRSKKSIAVLKQYERHLMAQRCEPREGLNPVGTS
jgi:hypothetical protein